MFEKSPQMQGLRGPSPDVPGNRPNRIQPHARSIGEIKTFQTPSYAFRNLSEDLRGEIDALGRKRDKLWRTTKNDGQDQQTTQTNGWPEMIFEYDPEKSRTNKTKHGIDFEEAKTAWDDPNAVEFASEYGSEERLGRIARIYRFGSKLWTVIFTYRWPAIRIISVRRARKAEEETYERKHSEDSGGV